MKRKSNPLKLALFGDNNSRSILMYKVIRHAPMIKITCEGNPNHAKFRTNLIATDRYRKIRGSWKSELSFILAQERI